MLVRSPQDLTVIGRMTNRSIAIFGEYSDHSGLSTYQAHIVKTSTVQPGSAFTLLILKQSSLQWPQTGHTRPTAPAAQKLYCTRTMAAHGHIALISSLKSSDYPTRKKSLTWTDLVMRGISR